MEILQLEINGLKNIEPLKELIKIKTLRLYNNQISDISCLKNLINLQELNITHNKITDISALCFLPNLNILSTYGNPLKSNLLGIFHDSEKISNLLIFEKRKIIIEKLISQ